MTQAQKEATARYRSKQIQLQALINPATEPDLANAWEQLLEKFGGSKKKALAWAIMNAPDPTDG